MSAILIRPTVKQPFEPSMSGRFFAGAHAALAELERYGVTTRLVIEDLGPGNPDPSQPCFKGTLDIKAVRGRHPEIPTALMIPITIPTGDAETVRQAILLQGRLSQSQQ
jgi:hypothetical protein